MSKDFIFWKNWLLYANVLTLFVGVLVAFAGNSIFFELHNQGTRDTFFGGQEMTPEVLRLKNWLFGIIGGTIVGFHLLAIFIIQHAFVKKERWAWNAIFAGLVVWFFIDSSISWFYGALYNIYLINLFALLIIGLPLLKTRKYFSLAS